MSTVNRIFECSRCEHVTIVQADPARCRACGSMTGVVKTVDHTVIGHLLEEGARPWSEDRQDDTGG
jgi:transcription elongation factor Elf1